MKKPTINAFQLSGLHPRHLIFSSLMLSFSSSLPDKPACLTHHGYEISGRSRSSFYQSPPPQKMPPQNSQGEGNRKEIERAHHRLPLAKASAFSFRAFCRAISWSTFLQLPRWTFRTFPPSLQEAIQ